MPSSISLMDGITLEPRQPATEPFQFPDGFLAAGTEEFFGYRPVDEAATLPLPKPCQRCPNLVLEDHVDTRCDIAYDPDPHYSAHPVYIRESRRG